MRLDPRQMAINAKRNAAKKQIDLAMEDIYRKGFNAGAQIMVNRLIASLDALLAEEGVEDISIKVSDLKALLHIDNEPDSHTQEDALVTL